MSDVAQAPVTTETAAAPSPVADIPVTTPEAQETPVGRNAVRNSVMARVREQSTANVQTDRPRDEVGRFVSTDAPAASATEPAPETPPAETPVVDANEPAAPAPDVVRIQISDNHPLRHRIGAEIEVPKQLEEFVRWANNQPQVRTVADQAVQRAHEAEQGRIRAEARANALQAKLEGVFSNSEELQHYQYLAETNPAVAEAYKRGKMAEYNEAIDQSVQQADQEFSQTQELQQAEATAVEFESVARTRLRDLYPAWDAGTFEQQLEKALRRYGSDLRHDAERGRTPALSLRQFTVEYMHPVYAADPAGSKALAAMHAQSVQANEQRIRDEAAAKAREQSAADEAARLADAAKRHGTRPPVTPGPSGNVRSFDGAADMTGKSPDQIRKSLRARIAGALNV